MKKILVIDDQEDNLVSVTAILKIYMPETKVLTAQSGAEGIKAAKKEKPDTILLDIIMPGMDGYEVCKKLKKDKLTKHIPLILLTAIKTDSESRVKGLNNGADAFLSKPIDPAELSAQVNVMLRIKVAEDKLRSEKANLEELVEARTIDISETNEKLRLEITERKHAEKIQRALYNISNAVIATDNLKILFRQVQKELGTIIDTTNFSISLYDHITDTFSPPFYVDEKEKHTFFPAGKTLENYVAKTKKPLLATKEKIKELEESWDVEKIGADAGIWLGVPLIIDEKIIGVFTVQSYTDEFAYDESDMEMLEFIGEQISISIDRKKTEQDLISAFEQATESDRLKSRFLATMSHELRTPLNAIIGFSDIIDEDLPLNDIIEFNKNINSSGKHLLSIIEDLFDITLIEAGEIKTEKNKFKLLTILNDVQNIIIAEQQKTSKENIALTLVNPSRDKDLMINSDQSKLQQILINLLKNALKFTEEGYVRFGYSTEMISDKPMLKFYVEDTGIGVPKDKQKLIFNIFRQGEEEDSKTYGGAGIGLSISKKLTKLLGGKIWLESEKGRGSTFYFTIPLEEVKGISIPIKNEAEKNMNLKKKTLLIVEDAEASFEFLKIILEKLEANTIWAKSGMTAIKYCNENPDIDLVLMDINMPIMNGYEATKEIKKIKPDLPIIAQTAFAIAGDREKSLDAGCDDYIAKPIEQEVLMKKIKRYLANG